MLYVLSIAALLFFLAHVVLLVAAFARGRYSSQRYLYSHITLWVTGLLVFVLVIFYGGKGNSAFLDFFDTPLKKGMILLVTVLLSWVAHTIVRRFVLPGKVQ